MRKKINLPADCIYSDYHELLKRTDIDVVDVLVPISENYEVAKDVLMAGKNLIAEKPFASTIDGAKELIKIKNEKKLKVMVAENFRYEDCYNLLKKELTNKTIGEVAYFILNTGADFENDMLEDTFAAKEWRQHPTFEGEIFLDGGIHDIALMRFLFGNALKIRSLGKKHDKSYCKYISINTIVEFDSNVIGNYSYFSKGTEMQKPPIGLRIFGTKGDIFLESKECGKLIINLNNKTSKKIKFKTNTGYYNEFLNYYEGNIVSTPEKELGDIEMIFSILNEIDKNYCEEVKKLTKDVTL